MEAPMSGTHVLAVADWAVDPGAVAKALRAEHDRQPVVFDLLVPSRLPGLDWIGDPNASRPCAEQQLSELARLARKLGLVVDRTSVGDPERVAAIAAALDSGAADRVLLFDRRRALAAHPLSVARRVQRRTGRAVRTRLLPALSGTRCQWAAIAN
jgi:hypothetical protein